VDKIEMFFDHMEYLFPDVPERELFLDVMAFWIQEPGERMSWVPLLVSKAHGIGKSWLDAMMESLIGIHNCGAANIVELTDESKSFNEFMYDTQFCCIHEVREGGRGKFQMTERLKHIITEKTQQVNKKGGFKGSRRIYTNFLFLSNHPDALALDEQDRRIWVHFIDAAQRDPDYYTALWNMLDDPIALDQLWTWLSHRNLGLFNPGETPPMTDAKQAMIESNRCTEEIVVRMMLRDNDHGYEVATFSQIMEILTLYNETGGELRKHMVRRFIKELVPHVFSGTGERVKWGGVKQTPWIIGGEGQWKSLEYNSDNRQLLRNLFDENQRKIEVAEFDD